MKLPVWAAIGFVAVQAVLVATAVIRHDTAVWILAGLILPFTLLAIGFAYIGWKWPGKKQS